MMTTTDQRPLTLGQLPEYIDTLNQAIEIGVRLGHHFGHQWALASVMRREARALRQRIQAMIQKANAFQEEVDPDDELSELLLRYQQAIQRTIESCNEALHCVFSFGSRWMLRWTQRLLVASLQDLDESRTAILKHNDEMTAQEDAYWAAEADAVLDRIKRGEEAVIPFEQWEARHGLGG